MNTNENVTLTMTTCKRFNLFEKTVKTFAENCEDLDLITNILCVDDNSSPEDCRKINDLLVSLFPDKKIELICKTFRDKGLGQSMNMIWNRVDTRYIFHLEDDWEFVKKGHFIRDALAILKDDNFIKSVIIRKTAYSNLPIYETKSGHKCYLLEMGAKVNEGSGIWLCGYSLNPSVQDLGDMKSRMKGFPLSQVEFEFGREFYDKGMRAVATTEDYVQHIGQGNSSFELNWTPR